jgi:ParB-like chromosome segregation protein Spo0J
MKLSKIKPNPDNPRVIKDASFKKLCNSIKDFPKMMALRPIVTDADDVVLGGNMRLKALQHLGYKEIPDEWVRKAEDLTDEERKRFIIADNVSGGEWDWDTLANEWDAVQLEEWGLEVSIESSEAQKKTYDLDPYNQSHILVSYDPNYHSQIMEIINQIIHVPTVEIETSSN